MTSCLAEAQPRLIVSGGDLENSSPAEREGDGHHPEGMAPGCASIPLVLCFIEVNHTHYPEVADVPSAQSLACEGCSEEHWVRGLGQKRVPDTGRRPDVPQEK